MTLLSAFGEAAVSLESIREALAIPRPASLRQMCEANDAPIVLSEPLVTSDGVALGGAHSVTLRRDGSFDYTGHFRATGWPSYDASVSTRVVGANGLVATLAAHGSVHGSNESGDRQMSWSQTGVSPLVATYWIDFRHAHLEHDLQYDSDLFGTVGAVASFLGKAVAAAFTGGTVGVVILLGAEATDAVGAQEIALPGLVGVVLAGGTLLVVGSGGMLAAIVVGVAAGAITAAMVRQRRLSDEEFAVVDRVYRGTLPRERIVLTNLLGASGRPFTVPAPGNAILVNLGDGFENPTSYTGSGQGPVNLRAAGQLLIHELCHAWQIEHSTFLPTTMCKGVINQVGTLGGDMSVYLYGDAGLPWGDYNLEQQASIVDQWFAGTGKQKEFPPAFEGDGSDGKPVNPYWRYVRDNIRAGVT